MFGNKLDGAIKVVVESQGCAPKNFTSKYGIWFRIPTRDPHFSPKGFPMEGVSVEPNHEVKQTVTDFFDDKDTAIEYVLNKLIILHRKVIFLASKTMRQTEDLGMT